MKDYENQNGVYEDEQTENSSTESTEQQLGDNLLFTYFDSLLSNAEN